jgi:hypothetical protein
MLASMNDSSVFDFIRASKHNLAGKHPSYRKALRGLMMDEMKTEPTAKKPLTVKEMAAMGGKARAEGLTKKRKKEIAAAAANARWSKNKKHG